MPYIRKEDRAELDETIDALASKIQDLQKVDRPSVDSTVSAGALNYVCTRLALTLYPSRKYWTMALVVGVFVTVVLEYYRRWAAPYENMKARVNGDVYPRDPEGA
jgi:hypothetical protein